MLSTGFALILLAWGVCAQDDDIIAFSARLNTPMNEVTTSTPVVFEETTANAGGWYDTESGGFSCPPGQHGLYYMSYSVGTPEGKWCQTNVFQAGTGRTFSGLKQDNMNTDNVEFSSRGYMQEITANQVGNDFEIRGDRECSLIGDPYGTTTWTMFRYGDVDDLGVSFSVARNNDFSGEAESVNWNREFVNSGGPGNPNPMNSSTGFFKAPFHGYYFFHFSAMSVSGEPLQAMLFHWPIAEPGINNVAGLNRTSLNIVDSDTTGRSMFIEMNMNDQVSLGNMPGSSLGTSSDGFELSFSGFGYGLGETVDPDVVAFCAYMMFWEWNEPVTQVISDWHGTTVNVNGTGSPPFDPVSGDFIAPLAGTYFISYSIGVYPNKRGVAILTDNLGYPVSSIDRRNSGHDGVDTLSRDVVVDLGMFQRLRIQIGSGSHILSSPVGREVSFMGMRLRHLPTEPPL